MSRGLVAIWTFTLLAASGAAGVGAHRYWSARSLTDLLQTSLERVRIDTARVDELRAAAPPWGSREHPGAGLTLRITGALAASAVPTSAMSSLSPETESIVGDPALRARRCRAVVTLAPVTLPQLGAFLAAWREREAAWIISSIDLSPLPLDRAARTPGRDLPLRVVIGLETLFLDAGGPP